MERKALLSLVKQSLINKMELDRLNERDYWAKLWAWPNNNNQSNNVWASSMAVLVCVNQTEPSDWNQSQ